MSYFYIDEDGYSEVEEYDSAEEACDAWAENIRPDTWHPGDMSVYYYVEATEVRPLTPEDDEDDIEMVGDEWVVAEPGDYCRKTYVWDPPEPKCPFGKEHEYERESAIGLGGANVRVEEVCTKCGATMITETAAQCRANGDTYRAVGYLPPDPDKALRWRQQELEDILCDLDEVELSDELLDIGGELKDAIDDFIQYGTLEELEVLERVMLDAEDKHFPSQVLNDLKIALSMWRG